MSDPALEQVRQARAEAERALARVHAAASPVRARLASVHPALLALGGIALGAVAGRVFGGPLRALFSLPAAAAGRFAAGQLFTHAQHLAESAFAAARQRKPDEPATKSDHG